MGKKWKYPSPLARFPSAYVNSLVFENYFNRLKEIGISTFEWKNLPPEIDERFLELTLFEQGMAVFYRDEIAERFVALTTQIGGELNIYRIPMRRRAYAPNGYNYTLTDKDSVLIFNNSLHQPSFQQTVIFATRLYEVERATDVNVKTQKFPALILSTETQRLTMQNLMKDYDGNVPFIYGDKSLDRSSLEVLNLNAPFVADQLQFLKHQIWNEALSYFGVESDPATKAERLTSMEASQSRGSYLISRYTRLNARRQAAKHINDMFGLNIEVNFRSDMLPGFSGDTIGKEAIYIE